jgi:dihydroxyacetone kinase-like predicted kinase
VHTNAPGTVITEALTYGSLLTVKVENMREQHSEVLSGIGEAESAAEAETIAEPEKKYSVVAVCAGEGIEAVFRDLGVDAIVSGGQTMNPSTEDILKKINATPSEYVFVFPNNKNIIMAAEQCAGLTVKKVIVIPTATIPQGIAALLAFEPELGEEELTANLKEAFSKVRTVQVTYAARDSEYDGHTIHEGDFLALLEGKIIAIDKDLSLLLDIIGDSLTEGPHEFITIFYGADVTHEKAEESMQQLQERLCDSEITLIPGGQPVYHYIISAE